jgi:hypothetical protein
MNKWIMKVMMALLAAMVFSSSSSKTLLLLSSEAQAHEPSTRGGSDGSHGGSCN